VTEQLTAERFIDELHDLADPDHAANLARFFKTGPGEYGEGDVFIGIRTGGIVSLARRFKAMPIEELDKLLDSPVHEVRMGALKIMSMQAESKRTPEEQKRALYELYLRRTDAIDNWDLVDVSCTRVVGAYLADKPRDVLYELARSENLWERRIAMISTGWFIRMGELDDTFRIAEILLGDTHDLIHKAVGWMLREAGKRDLDRLRDFLESHAATMPRTALRYAIERMDADERAHFMGMKARRR
jgi:3-methyladenine DNA glycosylase AlkD